MKRIIIALGMIFLLKSAIAQTKGTWQQEVNYTINVTLDDQSHMLRGSEEFYIPTTLPIRWNSSTFICGPTHTRTKIQPLPDS